MLTNNPPNPEASGWAGKKNMPKFENLPLLNTDEEDEKVTNRRQFLKGAVTGAVISTTGISLATLLKQDDKLNTDTEGENEIKETAEKATSEQEKIETEDIKSVREILSYNNKEEIEINEKVINKTKEYWKERYSEGGKMHQDFIIAYKNMQEWTSDLENIFTEEGVPEKFIYLAIPESHWQLKSKSSAGACGPYQLMSRTARKFGCKNNKEMEDPLKSARACAKYLKYLHDKFDDWDLALSGYNGGFIWKYKKQEKEKLSYPNFLKYIETNVKEKRKKVDNLSILYKVKKNDTIWKLTHEYSVKDSDILFNNKPASKNIRIGQQLVILIKDEKTKRKVFEKLVKDSAENLNYPAKFNAVIELIEEMEENKGTQLARAEKM